MIEPLPANFVRKSRVNDVVHSFCWQCRHIGEFDRANLPPFVMLGFEKHDHFVDVYYKPLYSTDGETIAPFAAYLFAHVKKLNRLELGTAIHPVWMLERYTRDWSAAEWTYALTVFRKYYDPARTGRSSGSPGQYDSAEQQHKLPSNVAEKLSQPAAVHKCDELQSAGYVPSLPEKIPDGEGTGSLRSCVCRI